MPRDHFPVFEVNRRPIWDASPLYVRELCILKAIEEITSKPTWCTNVRDARITDNWKKEILGLNWNDYVKYADFTPSMADWVRLEKMNIPLTIVAVLPRPRFLQVFFYFSH